MNPDQRRWAWFLAPSSLFIACQIADRSVEERAAVGGAPSQSNIPTADASFEPLGVGAGAGAPPSELPPIQPEVGAGGSDAGSTYSGSSDAGNTYSGSSDAGSTSSSGGYSNPAYPGPLYPGGIIPANGCDAGDAADGSPPSDENPSCVGLAKTCGPTGDGDCCASSLLPAGTFYRLYDAYSYRMDLARVGSFRLDLYEATVGRFRKFVAAYSQTMIADGAGTNPNNRCDGGWNAFAWNPQLDADALKLASAVRCGGPAQTWSDSPGDATAESLPMNCLNWFEASAFCIWDGGRLPTEAEWGYAAGGGAEQRLYPWPGAGIAADDAVYGTLAPAPVGSKSPQGDGKWGQADLAGNVWEWTLEYLDFGSYPESCGSCNVSPPLPPERSYRGGAFDSEPPQLLSDYRGAGPSRANIAGVRCARRAP